MNNNDGYRKIVSCITKQARTVKKGVEKGEINVDEKLLNELKEKITDYCHYLYTEMNDTEIGLLVDKIFADELGYE